MDGGIHTVEQAHLIRLQSRPAAGFLQVLQQRVPQAVVLRIYGNFFGAEVAQGLGHQGAGANRVLVEIQPQHLAAALQRRAVGLELLNGGAGHRSTTGCERLSVVAHMRSRVAMPSSPSPSLRVSAVKRQRARRDASASGSALSTGTWS